MGLIERLIEGKNKKPIGEIKERTFPKKDEPIDWFILIFGQPYSSKLAVGNAIRKLSPCLSDCSNFPCAAIENLTVRNFTNGDSILVKWEGASTNYSIKVREKTNLNLPYIISGVTNEKSFVLKEKSITTGYIFASVL